MTTHRRVPYWLVLAATLLLVLGVFTYQRLSRRADAAGLGRPSPAATADRSQIFIVAGSALALLVAGWQMRQESRRREDSETELQETLASVEQQVAERTAALSQAMANLKASEELKDEFLATASHELRTPLNAVIGWVHVLQSGAPLDQAQHDQAVSAIGRNAKIQARLIEDLLDVSRLIQGRISLAVATIDVRAIIGDALATIRPAASAKGLTVHVVSPSEGLPVVADAQRLQQVVWNLLSNAVKFTPQGGAITVTLITVGDRAVLTVADTGEGIAAAFLPHMFEPFRKGSQAPMRTGMGLGLAIVQRLVELHGGGITVASDGVGKGAQFTMSLQLAPAKTIADQPPVSTDAAFRQLHVLVVEDDADSAAAVTAILRLHGCETQIASTAAECLQITADWRTDVLVGDIGLPDDDGYGLLRRLRNSPAGARIPAIALTAYARPEDCARALAAGFRAHLSKPLDPVALLREIAAAVSTGVAA